MPLKQRLCMWIWPVGKFSNVFRRHEVKALGIDNRNEAVSLQYKEDILMVGVYAIVIKDSLFYKGRFLVGYSYYGPT